MPTVDELSEKYLASRKRSTSSLQVYRQGFDNFFKWAQQASENLYTFDTHALSRYERALRSGGSGRLAESTINNRLDLILRYYKWLMTSGHLPINDLIHRNPNSFVHPPRETLSVDELRGMWQATKSDHDRVAFGLLAFTGLRNSDIQKATMSDLIQIEGRPALRLDSGGREASAPYAILPDVLMEARTSNAAGRRSGPILLSKQNNAADRRVLKTIVERLAIDAGITAQVLPRTLMFSMRNIALNRGFSYAGVVQSTGAIDARTLARIVKQTVLPQTMNAAERIARLVVSTTDELTDRLLQAEVMLYESDAPPAAPAMLVGATLENYLRLLCRQRSVAIRDEEDARINTYSSALREAKVITRAATYTLARLSALRNDASHGWFERINRDDVIQMIRDTRSFCGTHPLST